jgi:hypothetical protein
VDTNRLSNLLSGTGFLSHRRQNLFLYHLTVGGGRKEPSSTSNQPTFLFSFERWSVGDEVSFKGATSPKDKEKRSRKDWSCLEGDTIFTGHPSGVDGRG